jgi:hypothetical protein
MEGVYYVYIATRNIPEPSMKKPRKLAISGVLSRSLVMKMLIYIKESLSKDLMGDGLYSISRAC